MSGEIPTALVKNTTVYTRLENATNVSERFGWIRTLHGTDGYRYFWHMLGDWLEIWLREVSVRKYTGLQKFQDLSNLFTWNSVRVAINVLRRSWIFHYLSDTYILTSSPMFEWYSSIFPRVQPRKRKAWIVFKLELVESNNGDKDN